MEAKTWYVRESHGHCKPYREDRSNHKGNFGCNPLGTVEFGGLNRLADVCGHSLIPILCDTTLSFVQSGKPTSLDPGIGETIEAVDAEPQDVAYGGNNPALTTRGKFERLQVGTGEFTNGLKQFGSNSEVDCFRVQIRNRLFVKGRHLGVTLQFFDQDRISTAVCRANPYEHSGFRVVSRNPIWLKALVSLRGTPTRMVGC